jgi:polysaccharide export outer membrane protein
VLGAVNRPGGYVMQEDGKLNLSQALALAYGTSLQAATGKIRVIRRDPNGTVHQIPVSYKRAMQGKADPIMLMAEDVVYVPPSALKSALIDTQAVLGNIASTVVIDTMR